jgi:hypothetical protein
VGADLVTPGARLQDAQQAALSHDSQIARLGLRPVQRSIPGLPVVDRIIEATATLTIEGASSVDLTLEDPDWEIEQSGILTLGGDGRLKTLEITLDGVVYRLVQGHRDRGDDRVRLTFEDRVAALLKEHRDDPRKPMTASRGSMTRAQFIGRMVAEVRVVDIPYYSPDKNIKQLVARPDYPSTAPARGETGFDPGTRLRLKQFDGSETTLDTDQMRNAATALGVADQEQAGTRATLALAEAGIVEAPMFANPKGGDGTSSGFLQLTDAHLDGSTSTHGGRRDVALVARMFLTKGFTGQGGAIDLERQHPDWTSGQIAQAVQGSGHPERYGQVEASAHKLIGAFSGGDQSGSQTETVLSVKEFDFARGEASNPRESSWDAAVRLAGDVNWRFFTVGGVATFISDDRLLMTRASVALRSLNEPGLLDRPGYDVDHGKVGDQLELRVNADRWSITPGDVWALLGEQWGPVDGRFIVHTINVDLLDPQQTIATLTKPQAARKEPAPEVQQSTSSTDPATGGALAGADRALRWAKSKIGHYKETFANNQGAELNKLEATFGMRGEPWCAIFATTAVANGGVPSDCKTAAVAQIRAWAQAGTHGYTKGFRATPKPGDLMCIGTEHVALVEKVTGDSVRTIEGNTSAGQVARGQRLSSTGDFVRPDYPN